MQLKNCLIIFVALACFCDASTLEDGSKPKCGHWAVLRMCQLNGCSADLNEILRLLPSEKRGNDFFQLGNALETLGLQCEGIKTTYEKLVFELFPCIAHLKPNHFIVIESATPKRIFYYSNDDHKAIMSRKKFCKSWTGKILIRETIQKSSIKSANYTEPAIGFDTLLIDKGTIADPEQLEYVFCVHNSGASDLKIKAIKTSCSCLKSSISKKTVQPGNTSEITLVFKEGAGNAKFSYNAIVQSNDPTRPLVKLTAQGTIERTAYVSPQELDLGQVVGGKTCTRYVFVYCKEAIQPTSVRIEENSPKAIDVSYKILGRDVIRQHADELKTKVALLPFQHVVALSFRSGNLPNRGDTTKGAVIISLNDINGTELVVPFRGNSS